jgi:hypothetical protein
MYNLFENPLVRATILCALLLFRGQVALAGTAPEPTPTLVPSGFRISGCVQEIPGQGCSARGLTITLHPLGLTSTQSGPLSFRFEGIQPGNYTLSVSLSCNPFGCWPDPGEPVAYIAHIVNKGGLPNQQGFSYEWYAGDVLVASGTYAGSVAPGLANEATVRLVHPWPSTPQSVRLLISASGDVFASNNTLAIDTHALALKYLVDEIMYDQFNTQQNTLSGTFSFEDWFQAHIALMNTRFSQAIYGIPPDGIAPFGILDRV